MNLLRSWLRLEREEEPENAPALRELLDALDGMEPGRARHLAAFAYLLGRIEPSDLTAMRVANRQYLPGLSSKRSAPMPEDTGRTLTTNGLRPISDLSDDEH